MTNSDYESLKDISSVKNITAELSNRYQVLAKGTNSNTTVVGTDENYLGVRNVEIETGNFITEQNLKSSARLAVLGPTTANDLFGTDDPIGQTIKINSLQFKVIGVTRVKGGSGFNNQDDIIFIPLTTNQKFLTGENYVSRIDVQVENTEQMTNVQNEISTRLLERHKIIDPTLADFNILNQSDVVAAASSVTSTFTLLLAAIASISLIVGGIGIMNMMLTTVTERTKEIGLRKAIGAKKKDITLQFLIEAISLTLIGGFFGIIIGILLAKLISYFGNIQTSIAPGSVILAFGVSAIIGIIFGYYPANRAAKLNPIDALRYE